MSQADKKLDPGRVAIGKYEVTEGLSGYGRVAIGKYEVTEGLSGRGRMAIGKFEAGIAMNPNIIIS